jgi:hypothetical protein
LALAPAVAGVGQATLNFCTANPQSCFVAAGIGGIVSGGADAIGEKVLTGQIRPGQLIFSTINGAVSTPFGMMTGILGNAVIGAAGSAINADFQNITYGDTNSIGGAVIVGGAFGAGGGYIGGKVTNAAYNYFPTYTPGIPALLQNPNMTSPLIGVSGGSITQGGGSIFPSIST